MKNFVFFVDMDEVLADFVGGVARLYGISPEDLEKRRVQGKWEIYEALETTGTECWNKIRKARRFWRGLECISEGFELLRNLDTMRLNWRILSSPDEEVDCYAEKYEWIKLYLGDCHKLIATPDKHLLAKPNAILIDDREVNCQRFVEHGGRSILWPSIGNRLYPMRSEPVEHVMKEIKKCT